MGFGAVLTSVYFWIGLTFLFLLLFGILMIFLIIVAKKTHAIVEFKAWLKGWPIALFFQPNRYCEWKPIKPDAGIITDKDYGAFIIDDKATYIDKRTKNVLIPFDASYGASINVHAAKLADDLQYFVHDEEEMKKLRTAISRNMIDDNQSINVIKTSVQFGAIKNMVNAITPHNINSKIEKIIASRMKSIGNINIPQILLVFVGMLSAVLMGYLLISVVRK